MKSSEISKLIGLVERAEVDASSYWGRKNINYNLRFCLWPGQDDTGRKLTANLGKAAFPWDGASDARIRLADMFVNERVRLLKIPTPVRGWRSSRPSLRISRAERKSRRSSSGF